MPRIRLLDVVYWCSLLAADIFIFGLICVFLIPYEDSLGEGEFFGWPSMSNVARIAWGLYWLWIVVNGIFLFKFFYWLVRRNLELVKRN